ncbi:hypothetical protein CesoFtcFv8_000430 [Champsocephalus esox]|uniref:Agouti domain-containing protein n=1 Tax=Champsocephalus esox TaxID=159716 RepID=A0AAN8D1M9_9TELE|nr:hypothetical protein CesoFtcFv8_000430 [Champsocephalus esox]
MLGSVLLYCCVFSALRLSSSLVHGNIHLEDSAFLSVLERGHATGMDPALLTVDSPDDFLMDPGSYDEFPVAQDSVQLQGRSMRSSRRCVAHQQSCLGLPLPCCDACDTCYCRFFNAICYCRRVGHACPPRHR